MPGTPPPLDAASCRGRQTRLRDYLGEKGLDGAVFFDRHYVYCLTGYWHSQPLTPTAVLITREGEAVVATHFEEPEAPAADVIVSYVPNHLFTLKPNLSGELATALNPKLVGLGLVGTCQQTPAALLEVDCRDITEDYQYLRRKKDADEVAAFEFTIECADRAYHTARQLIEPGVEEVEVMAAMLEEATYAAGEFLSGWGQDFQSGAPGGFARPNREIGEDEIFVIDLGVGVRGYRCDLCRSFLVDGRATDEQQAAYDRVLATMKAGEEMIRPGVSCREMYEFVKGELDGWNGLSFFHHAGHGVGLDAHEVPRINPAWDDVFEEGDLVAFEPGLYGESLIGGIRLENNYLVTAEGARCLSHHPLDLSLSPG